MSEKAQLLTGTLRPADPETVSLGPLHGTECFCVIEQITHGAPSWQSKALITLRLSRLEHQGGYSNPNGALPIQFAATKFYKLHRLRGEHKTSARKTARWHRMAGAIGCRVSAKPQEA